MLIYLKFTTEKDIGNSVTLNQPPPTFWQVPKTTPCIDFRGALQNNWWVLVGWFRYGTYSYQERLFLNAEPNSIGPLRKRPGWHQDQRAQFMASLRNTDVDIGLSRDRKRYMASFRNMP